MQSSKCCGCVLVVVLLVVVSAQGTNAWDEWMFLKTSHQKWEKACEWVNGNNVQLAKKAISKATGFNADDYRLDTILFCKSPHLDTFDSTYVRFLKVVQKSVRTGIKVTSYVTAANYMKIFATGGMATILRNKAVPLASALIELGVLMDSITEATELYCNEKLSARELQDFIVIRIAAAGGAVLGTTVGAGAGASLLPWMFPLGTCIAVGATAGSFVGDYFGSWAGELVAPNLPDFGPYIPEVVTRTVCNK